MSYHITDYSKAKAKALKVKIKSSTNKNKKIDVYKNNILICSIGGKKSNGVWYYDYPTYIEKYGLDYANIKRALYKRRHEKDRHVINTPGYYADQILW